MSRKQQGVWASATIVTVKDLVHPMHDTRNKILHK